MSSGATNDAGTILLFIDYLFYAPEFGFPLYVERGCINHLLLAISINRINLPLCSNITPYSISSSV